MAMKIVAGENVGRQDIFLIDPKELVVDEAKNTRWQPHDDAKVATLVTSFKEEGQLQPCVGRRLADHRVQLVAGFRRWRAATQYNQLYPDQPMKLAVRVLIMNEEEALRRSVVENREREETTPMDDAVTQRRFREEFGWTDTKIADFYKVSPPYVGILKKLLLLPADIQVMVHEKQMSVQAAVALSDLAEDEQKAIVAVEPATPGVDPAPVTSATIIKKVREKKIEKGGKQARSLKEVKDFLEGLTGPADPLKDFADLFLKFIQGSYTDATMEKKLKGLLVAPEATESPAATPEAA